MFENAVMIFCLLAAVPSINRSKINKQHLLEHIVQGIEHLAALDNTHSTHKKHP